MNETIPAIMIAHLSQLGQRLGALALEHQDATLAMLEQEVLAAVRAVMPLLLSDVIHLSTSSLQPAFAGLSQPCPTCGQRLTEHDWRSRTVKTICGRLAFQRSWYACAQCGHGFSPTDRTLALAPRARLSAGLQEWLIEAGAERTFRGAAGEVEHHAGIEVSHETVRRHTEARGLALEAQSQEAQRQVVKTQEAAEPVERAPGQLVVETDGVMVHYQSGWHEVKLGLVGSQVEGELQGMSYVAARESAEAFGPRLLAEAARRGALEIVGWSGPVTGRGLAQLRPVVILGDGAVWIWNLAGAHFGERIEILDFYHASEHVWTVGKALLGEGTMATTVWAEERLHELRHRGAEPLLHALAEAKAETAEAAEVLRREKDYFRNNAHRMAYPDFAAQGLPLGSGAVESSARHLVQMRMKVAGARWSDQGGQAVLNVRCRLISGRPLAA